jgi:catalase
MANRETLTTTAGEAMGSVPQDIAERQLGHLAKAHPGYAAGVLRELERMTREKASQIAQQQKMP